MNRRHFLKSAAVLAVAGPVLPMALPEPEPINPKLVEYYVDWMGYDGITKGRFTSPDLTHVYQWMVGLIDEDEIHSHNKYSSIIMGNNHGKIIWIYGGNLWKPTYGMTNSKKWNRLVQWSHVDTNL